MNILFLLHSYPKIGGIEVVTDTISKYLERKHSLYYLSRIFEENGKETPANCFYFPSKKRNEAIAYYNNLVDELKIDVVIHQGPFLPFNAILSNNQRNKKVRIYSFLHFMPGFEFERIKYVWMTESHPLKRVVKRVKTALGLNTLQYNPNKTRRKYQEIYDFSAQTFVLSPAYIPLFKEAYHISSDKKMGAISNPARYRCDEADVLSCKKKTVLFVGRLELESKRVDRLLEIWNLIDDKKDWVLKIVGDGPHRAELEKMVAEKQIEQVEFLGAQKDVTPFYKEADVVALTSSYEGLSLCFIEGIQFGAIPMAFDVSLGNRELLTAISPELLIAPFDLEAYANTLSRWMNDETAKRKLAENALAHSAGYRIETIGKEWDKFLES